MPKRSSILPNSDLQHATLRLSMSLSSLAMPNVAQFAKALYALHQVGCLKDPRCRPAVGMFVRQATETTHWHLTTDYRSKRAAEELSKVSLRSPKHYHAWCRKNLRHEHMVPISEVIDMLVREPNVTEDFIASTLRRNGLRATIHRDEDATLSKMGLGKRMPASFWHQGSPYFQDPLARYKEADLYKDLVKRTRESWYLNEG